MNVKTLAIAAAVGSFLAGTMGVAAAGEIGSKDKCHKLIMKKVHGFRGYVLLRRMHG